MNKPLDSDTLHRILHLTWQVLAQTEDWTPAHDKLWELVQPYLGD